MSFRAVTWAFDQVRGLSANEKLVLLALAEFANDADMTWRSRRTIAERAECSVRTVDAHLKNLESYGLIERQARYAWCDRDSDKCAGRGAHKHRTGTLYHLNVGATPLLSRRRTSTVAKVATVEKRRNVREKSTVAKVATVGNDSSTVASLRSPQSQVLRTHIRIEPPIKPPDLTPPAPHASVCEPAAGQAGSGLDVFSSPDDLAGGGGVQARPDGLACPVEHATLPSGNEVLPEPVSVSDAVVAQMDEALALTLVAQCLPPSMWALDAGGASKVAALLDERIKAGWRPDEIRALMDAPIPPAVRRLSGLVAFRLIENISPDHAPARLKSLADAARDSESTIRSHVVDLPVETDPEWIAAWREAKRLHPDAGPVTLVKVAKELLAGDADCGSQVAS